MWFLRMLSSAFLFSTCGALFWGRRDAVPAHPKYELVPADISRKGQGYFKQLQEAGSAETFLDRLFGTDCYSSALHEIGADCRHLSQAAKSRLAFSLTACHLQQLGQVTQPCKQSMSLKQCADAQDERGYSTYLKFLAEVDSVCLFIQSQDFQKHAEHMLNVLYGGSRFATEALVNATAKLDIQEKQLRRARAQLSGIHELQESVAQRVLHSLETVAKVQHQAASIQAQMAASLEMEVAVLEKQTQALHRMDEHERAEEARAADTASRWQVAEAHAKALVEEQTSYRTAQQQMLLDIREMSYTSDHLKHSLSAVLGYTRRSNSLMAALLGRTYQFEDVVFYGGTAAGILALGAFPVAAQARLPLAGLLAAMLAAERALLSHSSTSLNEHDKLGAVSWMLGIAWELPALKAAVRRAYLMAAVATLLWQVASRKAPEDQMLRELRAARRHLEVSEARQLQALQDLKLDLLQQMVVSRRAGPAHQRHLQLTQHPGEVEVDLRSQQPQAKPRNPSRLHRGCSDAETMRWEASKDSRRQSRNAKGLGRDDPQPDSSAATGVPAASSPSGATRSKRGMLNGGKPLAAEHSAGLPAAAAFQECSPSRDRKRRNSRAGDERPGVSDSYSLYSRRRGDMWAEYPLPVIKSLLLGIQRCSTNYGLPRAGSYKREQTEAERAQCAWIVEMWMES